MSILKRQGSRAFPINLYTMGESLEPTFYFRAEDASGSSWPAVTGSDLTLSESAPDFLLYDDNPLGSNDLQVGFSGSNSGHFVADNNGIYNLQDLDLAIHVVAEIHTASAARNIFGKSLFFTGNFAGYWCQFDSSQQLSFTMRDLDGPNSATVTSDALIIGKSVYYDMWIFVDLDETSTSGSQAYINGKASGDGASFSSVVGTLSTNSRFRLGLGNDSFSSRYEGRIVHVSLYGSSSLWPGGTMNHIEWSKIARESYIAWAEGKEV